MLAEDIVTRLREALGEAVLELKVPEDKRIYLKVPRENILEIANHLKNEFGFDMPISAGGTDYPKKNVIELFWIVWHSEMNKVIILKCEVDRENPEVNSLTKVWPGVQKFERETWELLGVNYRGHPRLKPLLLPEDWTEGYPLRKDFDLKPYRSKWGEKY